MVKLIALRPLSGSYGFVHAGQQFETDEAMATELEAHWPPIVQRVREPNIIQKMFGHYENKMIAESPENKHANQIPLNPVQPPLVGPQQTFKPPRLERRKGKRRNWLA